ncbi:reverse transcriptase (RNA-dependent DNA polymerase) [Hirsutella rhossiliensis]|uniref:Reverse transcriptase (RNA-dependent DNA polymerase) domain-containing protein n=1 Tax=Hirsutella rhossiliensis TaxID=111463 RepID=A0A9P8MIX7_9HYPO|nr:reverse transcriptase (RNA-dependent DNA polymerase) domain-containing protein [Hirsutella rhossiliensis]KAH0957208.1 reverse transcriptase (RNA-dependent DNA polymerase) domain-containing protein [Hirsutella rhossiliensis]
MKYPMPLLEDTLVANGPRKYGSDGISVPAGNFPLKVMPFGLTNGPAIFQCFINDCLRDILDIYCSSYADDILIYSESAEENVRQTEEVIRRLAAAGLQGDIKKSSFCVTEVDYLGLVIKAGEGIALDPKKKQAILEWRLSDLKSTKAIRSFLGLVNFVRRFSKNDNSWKPVAYFSKTLSSTETKSGGQSWLGPFEVVTDHEALKYFATKRVLSSRQACWAQILSEFDYKMTYRPGKENIIADALSRKSENFETVRARDLDSRTMELVPNDRIPKEDRRKGDRIWVPEYSSEGLALRTALIRKSTNPNQGVIRKNKMKAMLRPFYYWPRMDEDLARYARNCQACQEPWHTVLVDGKDMPNDRNGFDYVWTFICKLSKLILTIPGKKTDTAERLAKRYYRRVFGHLGLPKIWLSDNGPQFISKFMAKVNEMTGTEHKFGSAYHAQTQGGVEITNQYLDQRLTFYVSYFQDDWSMTPIEASQGRAPHAAFVHIATDKQVGDWTDAQKAAKDFVNRAKKANNAARF